MKNLFFVLTLILLFSCASNAKAANQQTTGTNPSGMSGAINPPVNPTGIRIMNQWKLITTGLKSGKLTEQQAVILRDSLKSIHKQQSTFLRTNTNHQLTSDQQSQLDTLLDKNSQLLGETPVSN